MNTLRERQTAATREEILDVALALLSKGHEGSFSHEEIAREAGMGVRTVYRHFPDRGQLLQALWVRVRETTNTRFPAEEEEILPLVQHMFQEFDTHEPLIRALLTSPAGTEVRERGGAEGRPAFAKSLEGLLRGLSPEERARVTAVFVAIYSAPFWQLLRDRGNLSGPEVQAAATWALEVLLKALKDKQEEKE